MRSIRNDWCLACAAILALAASPVFAQTQPPATGSSSSSTTGSGSSSSTTGTTAKPRSQLEEWLERAVKTHPDIKVAEAKLRTAMAELEQARSQVMQKVLAQYYAIQTQKIAVEKAELDLARLEALEKTGAATAGTAAAARANIVTARAKLAELQAQAEQLIRKKPEAEQLGDWLRYRALVDLDRDGHPDILVMDENLLKLWRNDAARAAQLKAAAGPMAERIRKALDTRVTVSNESLDGILKKLQDQAPGLLIKISSNVPANMGGSVTFKELPLGAALQWIEDHLGCQFYVREYGLLLAHEKDVPGGLRMIDFWKGVKEPAKAPAPMK